MYHVAMRPPQVIETKRITPTKDNLLDRLGGVPALDAVIDSLYFRVMADDDLTDFFGGVDLRALKVHQRQFLSTAFSHKAPSSDSMQKRLMKAHRRLFSKGLNESHFDRVVGHLIEALSELLVDRCLINEVVELLSPFREMFETNGKAKSAKARRFRFKKWTKRQGTWLARWL